MLKPYFSIAKGKVGFMLSIALTVLIMWCCVSPLDKFLHTDYNTVESEKLYNNRGPQAKEGYIAHGGGIGEYLYTNSEEAVYDSLQRGFQFIELDIIETDDGHLLAAHDRDYFCKLTGIPQNKPLISHEVKKLKINKKYTVLLGKDILRIMKEHPEMILVTDKITNYDLLMKEIPLPDRIVIECFSPSGIIKAKEKGFVYTPYSLWTTSQLHQAIKYGMKYFIMSGNLAFRNDEISNKIEKLHQSGVCMMVYDEISDNAPFLHQHLGKKISKFYTGRYAPNSPLPEH